MAYMQLGAVDPSHFNCTKYPGICKPSDFATLAIFKNLQAQLNRVAQALGFKKVTVDGDIGSGVTSLLSQIAANLSQGGVSVDPARNILIQAGGYQPTEAAANADTLGNAAQGVADQMSVPAKISQPSSGSSVLVSATGAETSISTPTPASASLLDSLGGLGGLSATTILALAAGAGVLVYMAESKGSKTKKSAKRLRYSYARR